MKNIIYSFILFLFALNKIGAINDTLFVYYLENYPYSYTEKKMVKGLEIEIINEYINWVKNDGVNLIPIYKSFDEFDKLYEAVKKGKSNVIGLGSVTINTERIKDISFSPPYLKNVSILISDGRIPTMKSKSEVSTAFTNPCAITLKNSTYEKYLLDIKKHFISQLNITYTNSEFNIIDSVANNKNVFGYCDILSYWTYTKTHKDKFIKIQKIFTFDHDNLGFIVPKISTHEQELSEFFESGFGFIATKKYHQILEEYLSYEVLESVKVD